jgi:hypothetical protein
MYAGVLFGGPRWSDTVVENVNLPPTDLSTLFYAAHSKFEDGVIAAVNVEKEPSAPTMLEEHVILPGGNGEAMDLEKMKSLISDHNPSIDEIDKAIDVALLIGRWKT